MKERLIDYFAHQPQVRLALLFGSFARGTQRPDSDVDVALDLGHAMSAQEKMDWIDRLMVLTGREVDVIDLQSVGQPLLNQIMGQAQRICGSREDFVALAIKQVNTAQDFLPYLQRNQQARLARWLNG